MGNQDSKSGDSESDSEQNKGYTHHVQVLKQVSAPASPLSDTGDDDAYHSASDAEKVDVTMQDESESERASHSEEGNSEEEEEEKGMGESSSPESSCRVMDYQDDEHSVEGRDEPDEESTNDGEDQDTEFPVDVRGELIEESKEDSEVQGMNVRAEAKSKPIKESKDEKRKIDPSERWSKPRLRFVESSDSDSSDVQSEQKIIMEIDKCLGDVSTSPPLIAAGVPTNNLMKPSARKQPTNSPTRRMLDRITVETLETQDQPNTSGLSMSVKRKISQVEPEMNAEVRSTGGFNRSFKGKVDISNEQAAEHATEEKTISQPSLVSTVLSAKDKSKSRLPTSLTAENKSDPHPVIYTLKKKKIPKLMSKSSDELTKSTTQTPPHQDNNDVKFNSGRTSSQNINASEVSPIRESLQLKPKPRSSPSVDDENSCKDLKVGESPTPISKTNQSGGSRTGRYLQGHMHIASSSPEGSPSKMNNLSVTRIVPANTEQPMTKPDVKMSASSSLTSSAMTSSSVTSSFVTSSSVTSTESLISESPLSNTVTSLHDPASEPSKTYQSPAKQAIELSTKHLSPAKQAIELSTKHQSPAKQAVELSTKHLSPAKQAIELSTKHQSPAKQAIELSTKHQSPAKQAIELSTKQQSPTKQTTELSTNQESPERQTTESSSTHQSAEHLVTDPSTKCPSTEKQLDTHLNDWSKPLTQSASVGSQTNIQDDPQTGSSEHVPMETTSTPSSSSMFVAEVTPVPMVIEETASPADVTTTPGMSAVRRESVILPERSCPVMPPRGNVVSKINNPVNKTLSKGSSFESTEMMRQSPGDDIMSTRDSVSSKISQNSNSPTRPAWSSFESTEMMRQSPGDDIMSTRVGVSSKISQNSNSPTRPAWSSFANIHNKPSTGAANELFTQSSAAVETMRNPHYVGTTNTTESTRSVAPQSKPTHSPSFTHSSNETNVGLIGQKPSVSAGKPISMATTKSINETPFSSFARSSPGSSISSEEDKQMMMPNISTLIPSLATTRCNEDKNPGFRSFATAVRNSTMIKPEPRTEPTQRHGSSAVTVRQPPAVLHRAPREPAVEPRPTGPPVVSNPLKNKGDKYSFELADDLKIHICYGDLVSQTVDAIVNCTDGQLTHVTRTAMPVAAAAGNVMIKRCQEFLIQNGGSLETSQVFPTVASGALIGKVSHILHVCTPLWVVDNETESSNNLLKTYLNCMTYASDQLRLKSIAFPLVGSEYPPDVCINAFFKAMLVFIFEKRPGSQLRNISIVIDEFHLTYFCLTMIQSFLEQILLEGIDGAMAEAVNSYYGGNQWERQQNNMNESRLGEEVEADTFPKILFRGPAIKRPKL